MQEPVPESSSPAASKDRKSAYVEVLTKIILLNPFYDAPPKANYTGSIILG
jgi:hypothetical protein